MAYFTIPGSGLVLEPAKIGGLDCWKDINQTAWWPATRTRKEATAWGTERLGWYDVEIGVSVIYFDDDGYLTRRHMEAVNPGKTNYAFDDGSTLRQAGKDFPTRFRVSDLIECEVGFIKISGSNFR